MAEYFDSDWYAALRDACASSSQTSVAQRLGLKAPVVNGVLKGRYKGRIDRVEIRVRGELMRLRVQCPVLGEISARRCQDEQRRPFAATSPLRVQLFKTCRTCGEENTCQHS